MISAFGTGFIQRLSIACLTAICFSLAAMSAFACTPAPPTPWFNENVHLADTAQPSGIIITQDGHTVTLTNGLDGSSFYITSYNRLQELGKSVGITSYDNELSANGYYVTALEPRNIIQDNRPADVKLPHPQDTVAQMILNQKTYGFQLTISYELNDRYIPDSVYVVDNQCKGYSLFDMGFNYPGPLFVPAVLTLIVLISTFIVLLKKYKSLGR